MIMSTYKNFSTSKYIWKITRMNRFRFKINICKVSQTIPVACTILCIRLVKQKTQIIC